MTKGDIQRLYLSLIRNIQMEISRRLEHNLARTGPMLASGNNSSTRVR